MPTAQEIQSLQGTRLEETPPWMSYAAEMGDNMSPELAAQVEEYSQKHYTDAPISSQTQEELCRLQDANQESAKEYQWLTPEEYENVEARTGTVIDHAEFIRRLRKHGIVCFYKQHPHHDKAVLWVSKNGLGEPEVACWVQVGPMPELSIMNFDAQGIPLAERRRGWRTCLLQIILKGIISEDDANKLFGYPKYTEQFDRYNYTLHMFRNAGGKLSE